MPSSDSSSAKSDPDSSDSWLSSDPKSWSCAIRAEIVSTICCSVESLGFDESKYLATESACESRKLCLSHLHSSEIRKATKKDTWTYYVDS